MYCCSLEIILKLILMATMPPVFLSSACLIINYLIHHAIGSSIDFLFDIIIILLKVAEVCLYGEGILFATRGRIPCSHFLIDYNEDNKSMGMFDWNISICYCISKVWMDLDYPS